MKLKRSNDRKTANLANTQGDQSKIKNAFGLPAGKEFSCPGETSVCGKICYGKNIERYLPSVGRLLMHNWELVSTSRFDDLVIMLDDMITEFTKECDKHSAPKLFRIHWDGDFFSLTYTHAWASVIAAHPDVQFWAYTRNHLAASYLAGRNLSNLGLYFSADKDNHALAQSLRDEHGIRLATLADTFDEAKSLHMGMTGKPVGKCPEVAGRIPLITTNGGACMSCALCPTAKTDITFSVTGK